MANHVIVVLKDTAVNAFGKPFFCPSAPAALRALRDEANSKNNSDLALHPEDFLVFELGLFDDSTGRFDLHPDPLQISRGLDLKSS